MAAAVIAGVDEVYRVGGAQAIAAMAYGTESIPKVDVIVGPGSKWVSLAQREVRGVVGVPAAFAGPSEVVVIADENTPVDWAAIDVIVQAEHGPDGLAWLITWSEEAADAIAAAIDRIVEASPRRAETLSTLDGGGYVVLVDSKEQALEVSNAIAPEHLEILTTTPTSCSASSATPGWCLSVRSRPRRSVTTSPGRAMCCRRSPRPASRACSVSRTSSAACTPCGLRSGGHRADGTARRRDRQRRGAAGARRVRSSSHRATDLERHGEIDRARRSIALRTRSRSMEGYFSPQLDVSVRLNTNEAPEPPPAGFVAALLGEINEVALNRYPDRAARLTLRSGDRKATRRFGRACLCGQRFERGHPVAAARLRRPWPNRCGVRADLCAAQPHPPHHRHGGDRRQARRGVPHRRRRGRARARRDGRSRCRHHAGDRLPLLAEQPDRQPPKPSR